VIAGCWCLSPAPTRADIEAARPRRRIDHRESCRSSAWSIAQDGCASNDGVVAAAIIVFFLILLIGRFALRGKGVVSGKLASILVMFIVAWALIAVSNLSLADQIAGWLGGGVATLVHGVSGFLSELLR
jgi:hypothetical protein